MAYAAVISVLKILDELQDPDQLQNIPYPRSEVQQLREKICLLKEFLERNPSGGDLEVKIRDAMYDAETVFDTNLSKFVMYSESDFWAEENYISSFRLALDGVIREADSMAETAKKISPQAGSPPLLPTSSIQEVGRRNLVVGREAELSNLAAWLTAGSHALDIVSVFGISGTGKTHLARFVYNDPDIRWKFKTHGWANIPPDYNKKEVLLLLLRSMGRLGSGKGQDFTEDELAKRLYTSLRVGNYLIVLDDLCDNEAWASLKHLFPDYSDRSRVILITRRKEVAESVEGGGPLLEIRPLVEKESWSLFQRIVFRGNSCPEGLEETAMCVSANCRGLPLAIVTVGGVLMDAGQKDWKIAASSLGDCNDDYEELIDAVMLLSYKRLPQYAKACLLYMGIFPNNSEIAVSKLLRLWIAEGFIEKNGGFQSLEAMAEECLSQLLRRGIVLVSEQSPIGKMRTCKIGGVYLEFVKKKAEEEKFFNVVDDYTSHFPDEALDQGRFSILKNVRFANKDELKSKKVRSLLFGGVQDQYPLWVHLDFKLLRVLDALTIQFYSFPDEILGLVHLRYLALTYNREIPEKICRLLNLQFLIVLRHLSCKFSNAVSHLPMEIWNLKELRHLQLMGRDLPDSSTSPHLENLLALLDVSSHTCTSRILKRVPNLKKLGVRIESPALDAAEDFSFLTHLITLDHLQSFKCVVIHPYFGSEAVSSIPSFPATLTKISLSGCGFTWSCMNVIAALQNLESLKLRWYACRGSDWKQGGDDGKVFPRLKFLLLEDLDIVSWEASSGHFPSLTNLVIRHCYRLREIPRGIGNITMLKRIELVDGSSSAVKSAQKLKMDQWSKGSIQIDCYSSRDD